MVSLFYFVIKTQKVEKSPLNKSNTGAKVINYELFKSLNKQKQFE